MEDVQIGDWRLPWSRPDLVWRTDHWEARPDRSFDSQAKRADIDQLLQWVPADEAMVRGRAGELQDRLGEEMSDVLLYLVRLADFLDVDLSEASVRKMRLNAAKHPAEVERDQLSRDNTCGVVQINRHGVIELPRNRDGPLARVAHIPGGA